jgi:uncharacterized membrane protein YgcG
MAKDMAGRIVGMATKKVTVTIPEELLEEIRGEMTERGLSAYVTEALRAKLDHDRLGELVDWLQEEYGPVTEEERAAALEELAEIDAEHERRRGGGDGDSGKGSGKSSGKGGAKSGGRGSGGAETKQAA